MLVKTGGPFKTKLLTWVIVCTKEMQDKLRFRATRLLVSFCANIYFVFLFIRSRGKKTKQCMILGWLTLRAGLGLSQKSFIP